MKTIPILAFLILTSLSYGKYVPTPEKAVFISFGDDSIEWSMQFMDGNAQKIIAEFTPKGQQIQNWKEMVAQEITFTKKKVSKHLNDWKAMVTEADPNIQIVETESGDGSVTVIYKSKAFNEYSVRRFMKAKDGIYALAYHMRLNQFDESRAETWKAIIAKSELIPNPQKR
jgi:hypothetical protein